MSHATTNVDQAELAKFADLAHRWWDPKGPQRPLHDLNPERLAWLRERVPLRGARVLDVGCGGGLLSEALAGEGAQVVALDLAPELIEIARLHLLEAQERRPELCVDYRVVPVEALAEQMPASFDAVTCMEMLEHVPDPAAVIHACANLLKPGGRLFVSTLNRTPAAFALAIVGAEYLAGILPKGTHAYAQFIRPSELAGWMREAGLQLEDLRGLRYNPLTGSATRTARVDVNYLACAARVA